MLCIFFSHLLLFFGLLLLLPILLVFIFRELVKNISEKEMEIAKTANMKNAEKKGHFDKSS